MLINQEFHRLVRFGILVCVFLCLTTTINLYAEIQPLCTFDTAKYGAVISPDGKMIATNDGYSIRITNIRTQELFAELCIARFTNVIAFSEDGRKLATGDTWAADYSTIMLWDIASGELLNSFDIESEPNILDHRVYFPESVNAIALSPNNRYLACGRYSTTGSGMGNVVRVLDLDTKIQVLEIPFLKQKGYLAFFPDSRRILVWNTLRDEQDQNLGWGGEIWDIVKGEIVQTIEGTKPMLSADGKRIVGGTPPKGGVSHYTVWDVETRNEIFSQRRENIQTAMYAFSPDGTRALLHNEVAHTTSLLDIKSGVILREFGDVGAPLSPQQAFSGDGNLVLSIRSDRAYIWDISDLASAVGEAGAYGKSE